MKKQVSAILAASMAASMLVACGGSTSSAATSTAPAESTSTASSEAAPAESTADAGQAGAAMIEQRIDQGTVGIARRRMHHHPGGLVEHDQAGVLEQNAQRNILRHGRGGFGFRQRQGEYLPWFDPAGRLRYCRTVDRVVGLLLGRFGEKQQAPVLDEGFQAGARQIGQQNGQGTVQPFPGQIVGHG